MHCVSTVVSFASLPLFLLRLYLHCVSTCIASLPALRLYRYFLCVSTVVSFASLHTVIALCLSAYKKRARITLAPCFLLYLFAI
ncbi:MAG: hypothetical protein N3A67_09135 [Ignavibacteria bacterium]|nr:hypothetical protein [Ignavibacteria bacterium]